jgi:hypothetical protein
MARNGRRIEHYIKCIHQSQKLMWFVIAKNSKPYLHHYAYRLSLQDLAKGPNFQCSIKAIAVFRGKIQVTNWPAAIAIELLGPGDGWLG